LFAVMGTAHANAVCESGLPPLPQTPHPTVLTPLLAGLPDQRLPGQRDGLASGVKGAQSVNQLLRQWQRENCRQAMAVPPAPAPEIAPAYADAYVKQTEFDNTPYRFNMTQNGRRMTADDFDAWLQANGYSVGRRVELSAPLDN